MTIMALSRKSNSMTDGQGEELLFKYSLNSSDTFSTGYHAHVYQNRLLIYNDKKEKRERGCWESGSNLWPPNHSTPPQSMPPQNLLKNNKANCLGLESEDKSPSPNNTQFSGRNTPRTTHSFLVESLCIRCENQFHHLKIHKNSSQWLHFPEPLMKVRGLT